MRNSRPRMVDAEIQYLRLQRKHENLKQKVTELDSRAFLTASESFERQQLKKRKLATKDALEALRRTAVS